MINLKCLFKGHEMMWNRNIFGDEIIARGWKRTEFRCERCGHYEYISDFVIPTERGKLLEDVDPILMGRPTTNDAPWFIFMLMVFAVMITAVLYVLWDML